MKGCILGRCLHKSTSFGHSQHVPCNFSCNQTTVRPFLTEWTLPMICKLPYSESVGTNPHPVDIHNMSLAIFHAIRLVWDPFSPSGLYPWYVRFWTPKVFAQIHILWTFTTCPLQFFMQSDWCETLSHQVDSTHDMSGLYCEGVCRSSHPLVIPQHTACNFLCYHMQAWAPFSLSELYPWWAYWYETSF
jgi:hypothetical protein